MESCRQHWMLNTPVLRLISSCSMPVVPAIFLLCAYDLLETGLIARLCTAQLTALSFSTPVTTAMTGIAIAVSIATNSWVCRLKATQQGTSAEPLNSNIARALLIGGSLTLLLSTAMFFLSPALYSLLGANASAQTPLAPAALPLVVEFTQIRLVGWVFLILVWQINGILRSLGHMKQASLLLIGWMLLKSLVSFVWIGGGECSLIEGAGLIGAGYAHVLVDATMALVSVVILARGLNFQIKQFSSLSWRNTARELSVTGLNAGLQQFYTPLSIAVLTFYFAIVAESKVSILGIVFRIEAMALLVPMVFTASMPGLIAANWWAGNIRRVKQFVVQGFLIIALVQLVLAVVVYNYSLEIANQLTQDSFLHQDLQAYLQIVPFSFVGAGCAMLALSCLNAIGKSSHASMLGLSHRVLLILSLALGGGLLYGMAGIFWGIAIAHWLSLALVYRLLARKIWPGLGHGKLDGDQAVGSNLNRRALFNER